MDILCCDIDEYLFTPKISSSDVEYNDVQKRLFVLVTTSNTVFTTTCISIKQS